MIPLTVADVLRLDPFKGHEVLTGDRGLTHAVRAVTIDEVPDGFHFLKGGELVLTSFYVPSHSDSQLIETMEQYVERGVAGVAYKPGRFVHALPPTALGLAEAADLPVIGLPTELAWPDVVLPVAQHIFLAQSETLFQAPDLRTLIEALSNFIAKPVLLESPRFEFEAASSTFSMEHDGPTVDVLLQQQAWHEFLGKPGPRLLSWRGHFRLVLPVVTDLSTILGYLTIIHDSPPGLGQSPLVRHALQAIAHHLRHREALALASGGEAARLLGHLVTRGHLPNGPTKVYVIAPNRSHANASLLHQLATEIASWARSHPSGVGVWVQEGHVVLIAPAGLQIEPGASVTDWLERLLSERYPQYQVTGGRACTDASQWVQSYQDAMRMQRAMHPEGGEWFHLLKEFVPAPHLRSWVDGILLPIRDYDSTHGTELMLTLVAFFETSQNTLETAKRLSVHRNTVLYRLSQIHKLTHLDLDNPEDRLQCQIALGLNKLLVT